jgi:hypothetical protein
MDKTKKEKIIVDRKLRIYYASSEPRKQEGKMKLSTKKIKLNKADRLRDALLCLSVSITGGHNEKVQRLRTTE